MKKTTSVLLHVFLFTTVITVLLLFSLVTVDFMQCFTRARRLPYISSYPVMRVLIYGSTYDTGINTVSAHIELIDTRGNEIASVERSWKGWTLLIDFVSAEFSGKYILFPYQVKGNADKHQGTKLYPYYNENRKCLLLGMGSTTQDQRDMYYLGRFVSGTVFRLHTKFSRLRELDLSGCKTGLYYSVYTGFDGQLYITED